MELWTAETTIALELHVHVDALAVAGQAGAEVLAATLPQAVAGLGLAYRIPLASRLKAVLHECIADAAGDPETLRRWAGFLAVRAGLARPPVPVPAPAPLPTPGRCARAAWEGLHAGAVAWSGVLRFAVSLEALAGGLHAVSRGFRHLALQPACWRGQDVTLAERHLCGLGFQGGPVWGKAFTLLPALREARTVRVAGFADHGLRVQVLPPLRSACRALCPNAAFLPCSFCEHHLGEHVDLPTPRKLSAARKPCHEKGGGLLIGNGPLSEAQGGCRFFAVHIEQLLPGERLDIGVTSMSPHEHFADCPSAGRTHRRISFGEDLLRSWIIESSGLLVGSHAGLRIRDGRWDARRLRTGDEVGLLVDAAGGLCLSVNGLHMAAWRAQIPGDSPVYPVVDLFEGAPRVRLLPGAQPPPS